jgi:glycosyltransferase involved in cell wall biosynthesis
VKSIAYLLHRFPRVTDTFISREIRSLQKAGTEVKVISIWKPREPETKPELVDAWRADVTFLLPRFIPSVLWSCLAVGLGSPGRFVKALRLALATTRPGLRGLIYQMFYLAEAMLAARVLRRLGVNHVHNHFGDHSGIVVMLASMLSGIDYSISFHGPHVFLDGPYAAIKQKVERARFIRCISYFCRSQVLVFAPDADLTLLKIVHCGLDLARYQFRPPRETVTGIFCAARLAPEKGLEFLIQALALLVAKNYDLQLRIAGDGPSRDYLKDVAKKLGVANRVSLVGNLNEQEVAHELSAADLFILPSLAEGLPVSAMEAMAVGVPVIATNIAGTGELIDNGKSGLLLPPTSPEAIADAVVAMANSYEFRCQAAALARKKVVEEFDIAKESQKLNAYFPEFRKPVRGDQDPRRWRKIS